jgi:tRNA A-37 threonylcarbamoyl transferase component Bud32
MLQAPIPADEAKRLALLRACRIMYTPAEAAFDDVARLAADLCGTEIALITLVDSDHQWFKARVGVVQTETPRDLSFCGHCINDGNPFIIEDARADARFADNPLVTGEPFIRFYAGVPLQVEEGSAIGALSVADRAPRRLTERQVEALQRLARQISRELRLRRDLDRVSSSVPPAELAIEPGTVIGGRWRVARSLGRGSVGAVFEAHDPDGQRAAIKILLPEWRGHQGILERFAREARVLMRLTTPHVGRLLDVGNLEPGQGDLPFLVLEYLEGMDLHRVLEQRGRVPFREAFRWCADACDGVAEAHELGVVHRDLKPSNVFLAHTRERPQVVKVLDFGIATGDPLSGTKARLTALEAVIGSPAYMSPEQMLASRDVDVRSDVWSMGALLYELVTGKLPFTGSGFEMFAAAMTHAPVPVSAHFDDEPPKVVEEILLTCLRKAREERYPSMRVLSEVLRRAAADMDSA